MEERKKQPKKEVEEHQRGFLNEEKKVDDHEETFRDSESTIISQKTYK